MLKFHQVTIGGEAYYLRFTLRTMWRIRELLGEALDFRETSFMTSLTAILWGAMQETQPDITLEQAAGMLDRYIDDGHSYEEWMRELAAILDTGGFYMKGLAGNRGE
ncbi:MAG: hypothetical protein LIO46_05810 [Clostridiales bacterium]|nr:hypothetical protein [Clostridiales bacterium]